MSLLRTLPVVVLSLFLQACGGSDSAPTTNTTSVASAPATAAQASVPVDPAAAAAATFQDLEGHPVEIADFAGKKVFMNYWATWCAPCIKELPSINRAEQALASENYVFLLVSDESVDLIKEFVAEREFTGKFIKLNTYAGAKGINVMPTSLLYNEQGQQVKTWEGAFEWDSEEMLTQIRNP